MKVFKVWVDKWDYDNYDSFVCVAESKEDIIGRFVERDDMIIYDFDGKVNNERHHWIDYPYFSSWQASSVDDIHIEEVNTTKHSLICSSYHAG